MYLVKNAFRNMTRNKGKNILIGVIITVITICTCIALAIHKAGSNLVNTYTESNPLEVSFTLDMSKLRNASTTEKSSFTSLTVDAVKKYANSNLVKDYYYTLETSINGSGITAVTDTTSTSSDNNSSPDGGNNQDDKKMQNIGDFRITAYSNFAYLSDFTDGTKKITSGKMVSGSSDDKEVVISKDLADKNSLKVGDSITLALSSDSSKTYTYKIIGIYKDSSDSSSTSFMQMNALNSANQIYANLSSVQEILDAEGTDSDTTRMVANNGLTAKFYLKNNSNLKKFEKEAKKKGLSSYYTTTTNKEEILSTLKPIQNITTFSINFLIVILILGIVVLTVINFLNIRDRKYEIGVLRAIGMSKSKVTLQLVMEVLFVSIASLIIGTSLGTILSQPVTNKMLASEIKSYKETTTNTEKNFGGNGFSKPSGNVNSQANGGPGSVNKSTTNYVKSLKVKIDAVTLLELFGISILLTSTSALVASLVINKYNPNKILQNRT